MPAREARIETIDGQRTLVIETDYGLPPKLDELLRQMHAFGYSYANDLRPRGARASCESDRTHRFARFREGRWFTQKGPHPGVLELRLLMCEDCGAVCVRDVSLDVVPGLRQARPARLYNTMTGRIRTAPAVARRDQVLGWYSGARRNQREYR